MDPQRPPQHQAQHPPPQHHPGQHYGQQHGLHHHPHHAQQPPQQALMPGQSFSSTGPNGLHYRLIVEQQPIRARMCGFGDKDRRPITPPPCVRLVVSDPVTGEEVDIKKFDSTFCILQVDLWNEDASQAVNLVRHSSASPSVSISSATVTAYPPMPERSVYLPPPPQGASQWSQSAQYGQHPAPPAFGYAHTGQNYQQYPAAMLAAQPPSVAQHYTRNLIGMNAVNACRLHDLNDVVGNWFVLQDLSVRTEGTFRLKFTMCDVGLGQGNCGVSQGKCPVLATAFSAPFTVYSAKKFPGVVESTALSRCLAGQGIKIPIRHGREKSESPESD